MSESDLHRCVAFAYALVICMLLGMAVIPGAVPNNMAAVGWIFFVVIYARALLFHARTMGSA